MFGMDEFQRFFVVAVALVEFPAASAAGGGGVTSWPSSAASEGGNWLR